MGGGCDYDCVHPWWGGHGSCVESGQDDPAVCSCDAGYASRGATGNPSCVPKRVLVWTYIVLTVVSVLATVLFGWHMARYRHLPARLRSSSKAVTRIHALGSFSIYTLGCTIVGAWLFVQAGSKGYFDDWVIQVVYIVLSPSVMFGAAMIGKYWVQNLPNQLIAPGSVADLLAGAAENSNAFFFVGCFNAGGIAAFGVMTLAHPIMAVKLADLAIAGGVIIVVATITFVAAQITRHINQATLKASSTSRAFYAKAKRNVWQQAVTLSGVGITNLATITAKHLTVVGRSTPILTFTFQMLTAHVAGIIFAFATSFPVPAALIPVPAALIATRNSRVTGTGRASTVLPHSNPAAVLPSLPPRRPTELRGGGSNNAGIAEHSPPGEEKGDVISVHIKPNQRDVIEQRRGGSKNTGTAKTSPDEEKPDIFPIYMKPDHGDLFSPGRMALLRHSHTVKINSVVPR